MIFSIFLYFSSFSLQTKAISDKYFTCDSSESFQAAEVYKDFDSIFQEFQNNSFVLKHKVFIEVYMKNMRMFQCFCNSISDFGSLEPNDFLKRCKNSKILNTFGNYAEVLGVPVFYILLYFQKLTIFGILKFLPFENKKNVKFIQMLVLLLTLCFNFWVDLFLS